jgi:signal transduction histidine kinase
LPPPGEAIEILIVEDSRTQAERLAHMLEQHRYRLAVARNGREALAAIAERRPALVISDVVMPEMDGYELCRELKRREDLRNIPIILLTSLNDPVDVVRGLECGADNFLCKPCDEKYLLARISLILANHHLREKELTQMGVEVFFAGRKFFVTSDRLQILNLLLSTYEAAVERNRELAKTRDELHALNECLELKVAERTAALEAEVAERARAEAEVRRLNAELEDRVRQRTAQLEAANRELEAFSYSVSHDLRAPLRHVVGFVELLRKSAGEALNAASRRHLDTIADAARRMGVLIDELLNFSRLGRTAMRRDEVDFDALIAEVVRGFELELHGRRVAWAIERLPALPADAGLLRQVFANLVGNALKYTRPRALAEISVGARTEGGEATFFVRDNGVGFDMRHAEKLFGVFQRLHRADEFEGTGIGLANVRRIVARHGGRTWAEARPGEGATFYFTLPLCAESDEADRPADRRFSLLPK